MSIARLALSHRLKFVNKAKDLLIDWMTGEGCGALSVANYGEIKTHLDHSESIDYIP